MLLKQKQLKKVGRYILIKTLGQGQFGTVLLAYVQNQNVQSEIPVAIKQLSKNCMSQDQLQAFKQESGNLCDVNSHPNIVQFFEVIASTNNYYIVMEFCNGGNLKQYCEKYNNKLDEKRVQIFAAQILSGLKFLRDNDVLHRDIKPENILLDYQNNDIILKISDFGLSKCLKDLNSTQTLCGTPLYSSPELLNEQRYDQKSDL